MSIRQKSLAYALFFLFIAYVGSYLYLSRRAYVQADRWNAPGFWYFTPQPTASWRRLNGACVYLYWPLNAIDRAVGLGRAPASEPMWGLSK